MTGRGCAMFEALTARPGLLVVREIQEDENGATLCFQQGGHGRLTLCDANYARHLQIARRSRERQHPIGVRFGEGEVITELLRADNDVPAELWEEHPTKLGYSSGATMAFSACRATIPSPPASAPCWPRHSGRKPAFGSSPRSPTWRCWMSSQSPLRRPERLVGALTGCRPLCLRCNSER